MPVEGGGTAEERGGGGSDEERGNILSREKEKERRYKERGWGERSCSPPVVHVRHLFFLSYYVFCRRIVGRGKKVKGAGGHVDSR